MKFSIDEAKLLSQSDNEKKRKKAVKNLVSALDIVDSETRSKVIKALGELNDNYIFELLVKGLYYANCEGKIKALKSLKDIRAIEYLVGTFSSNNEAVIERSISILAEYDETKVGKYLIDSLEDAHERNKKSAIIGTVLTLGLIESSHAVETVLKVLDDYIGVNPTEDNVNVAIALIKSLGQIKDNRAVEMLIKAFGRIHSKTNSEILHSLKLIGDQRGIEFIEEVLNQDKYLLMYRIEAALLLGGVGSIKNAEEFANALETSYLNKIAKTSLLTLKDPLTVKPLIKILLHGKKSDDAAIILGEIKDVRAVEPLIQALNNQKWVVRMEAARSLGKLGDSRAIEALRTVSKNDTDKEVRKAASKSLALLKAAIKPSEIGTNEQNKQTANSKLSSTYNPDGEQYVKACLKRKYDELPETAAWNDPVFQKILMPLNSGNNEKAFREAAALSKEYSDFGILYWWWGSALRKMGMLDDARKVMFDALEQVNQKYCLCSGLAEVEWKERNLTTMVYWLAQSMHCQETLSTENYGSLLDSYLHLSYVAKGLGLSKCSEAFLRRVDTINFSVRLNPSESSDLINLTQSGKKWYIEEVIKGLVRMYP